MGYPDVRGCTSVVGVLLLMVLAATTPPVYAEQAIPASGAIADLVEPAVAANRAKEDAITSVRGYFASDFRRSPYLIELARQHHGQQADPNLRSVSAGLFVAGDRALKLDGVGLLGGTQNPWGIRGPAAPPMAVIGDPVAPRYADAAAKQNGLKAGAAQCPRTVIVRDGERIISFFGAANEGRGLYHVRPQDVGDRAIGQAPLDRILFCRHGVQSFAERLKIQWQQRGENRQDAAGTTIWHRLAPKAFDGVPCDGARVTWVRKGPSEGADAPFRTESTYWLAPKYALSPVRVEHLYWTRLPKGTQAYATLWQAERHREVEQGLFLPDRVRTGIYSLTPAGEVEWQEVHLAEFYEVSINGPLLAADLILSGPPIGARVVETVPYTRPSDLAGRHACWKTAVTWVGRPSIAGPDDAFMAYLQSQASPRDGVMDGARDQGANRAAPK